MFSRILIANRGEIACRTILTARRLGVESVAVFSDADSEARHVEMADLAVHIGAAPASESYLNGPRIVEAALETNCQAIHPGYGFLSENAEFAALVESKGLTFIGPSADAIRSMGLKDEAKRLMEAADVPVVPGYHGTEQDLQTLRDAAGTIGFPVLIKAVAGGGGKGMRVANAPEDFEEALAAAQREAKSAFGNDAVLIEKLITSPRHIEVQIFGDGHDVVHLFERDCSLQRRHQKVIEEAPAPGMTAAVRTAMTEAAVRAAKAIGYKGAGTIEFIADSSSGLQAGGFWFMEMNTRLQVEHPVTEAITGIDLVEWQLRVASGEPIPQSQDSITFSGHAIEARIYAEDTESGFLPSTGCLAELGFPQNVRTDSGVRAGDLITPHYDPMIAKLVSHAPTRDEARRKLIRGLASTRAIGVKTNLDFLEALADLPAFAVAHLNTGLIDQTPEITSPSPPDSWTISAVAAILNQSDSALAGFALWDPLCQTVEFSLGVDRYSLSVWQSGPDTFVVDGSAVRLSKDKVLVDGRAFPFHAIQIGGQLWVQTDRRYVFDLPDPLDRTSESAIGDVISAPMPGVVKSLIVAPGQTVAQGQPLGHMEAMKMELSLKSPRDGVIRDVLTKSGAQVEAGATLITLEVEDDAG